MSRDFVISNEGVQRFNECGCVETWTQPTGCAPKAYGYVLTTVCPEHTAAREYMEQRFKELREEADRLEVDR